MQPPESHAATDDWCSDREMLAILIGGAIFWMCVIGGLIWWLA